MDTLSIDLIARESYKDLSSLEQYLVLQGKNHPDIQSVYFANSNKELVQSDNLVRPTNYDPTTQDWYVNALTADDYYFSSPYIDAFSDERIITVSKKMVDNDNQIVGVLAIDVVLEELNDLVSWLSQEDGQRVMVIDNNGTILLHANDELRASKSGTTNLIEINPEYGNLLSVAEGEVMPVGDTYGLYRVIDNTPLRIISEYEISFMLSSLLNECIVALGFIIGGMLIIHIVLNLP
ncbi:MAG: hypothetical protein BEN18_01185 [Epulopiscium sp. Nuni2H_MBin001]|nr:MAG: hypothetical protein BEN18_01185 [Epulopiscium sp. Nuni2H_MBin001]